MIKKQVGGGKGVFSLQFHTAVHHQRNSGLDLKQVRKQELMQRLWRSAPRGLLGLFSYRIQDHHPTHNRLGPPILITN